eukprot:gene14927-20079_t
MSKHIASPGNVVSTMFPHSLTLIDYLSQLHRLTYKTDDVYIEDFLGTLCCETDPAQYKQLLCTSYVICKPLNETTSSTIIDISHKNSVGTISNKNFRDLINNIIASMIRTNANYYEQNCFALGYRARTPDGSSAMRYNADVECFFVNTSQAMVINPAWQLLTTRIGEGCLKHLLSQPILVKGENGCYMQVCGIPISIIYQSFQKSINDRTVNLHSFSAKHLLKSNSIVTPLFNIMNHSKIIPRFKIFYQYNYSKHLDMPNYHPLNSKKNPKDAHMHLQEMMFSKSLVSQIEENSGLYQNLQLMASNLISSYKKCNLIQALNFYCDISLKDNLTNEPAHKKQFVDTNDIDDKLDNNNHTNEQSTQIQKVSVKTKRGTRAGKLVKLKQKSELQIHNNEVTDVNHNKSNENIKRNNNNNSDNNNNNYNVNYNNEIRCKQFQTVGNKLFNNVIKNIRMDLKSTKEGLQTQDFDFSELNDSNMVISSNVHVDYSLSTVTNSSKKRSFSQLSEQSSFFQQHQKSQHVDSSTSVSATMMMNNNADQQNDSSNTIDSKLEISQPSTLFETNTISPIIPCNTQHKVSLLHNDNNNDDNKIQVIDDVKNSFLMKPIVKSEYLHMPDLILTNMSDNYLDNSLPVLQIETTEIKYNNYNNNNNGNNNINSIYNYNNETQFQYHINSSTNSIGTGSITRCENKSNPPILVSKNKKKKMKRKCRQLLKLKSGLNNLSGTEVIMSIPDSDCGLVHHFARKNYMEANSTDVKLHGILSDTTDDNNNNNNNNNNNAKNNNEIMMNGNNHTSNHPLHELYKNDHIKSKIFQSNKRKSVFNKSIYENHDLLSLSTPVDNVCSFIKSICRRVFTKSEILGSRHNMNYFLRIIDKYIRLGRYETFLLGNIISKIKISDIPWLKNMNFENHQEDNEIKYHSGNSYLNQSKNNNKLSKLSKKQYAIREQLFLKFMFWVFDEFINPILSACFYCTEAQDKGCEVLFYRKQIWSYIVAKGCNQLKNNFMPVSNVSIMNTISKTSNGGLITAAPLTSGMYVNFRLQNQLNRIPLVRFVPKKSSVRAITNLKSKKNNTIHNFTKYNNSNNNNPMSEVLTNSSLYNCLHVLRNFYLNNQLLIGFGVFGLDDIYIKFRNYLNRLDSIPINRFERCYDNIDTQALYDIIADIVKNDGNVNQNDHNSNPRASEDNRKNENIIHRYS